MNNIPTVHLVSEEELEIILSGIKTIETMLADIKYKIREIKNPPPPKNYYIDKHGSRVQI